MIVVEEDVNWTFAGVRLMTPSSDAVDHRIYIEPATREFSNGTASVNVSFDGTADMNSGLIFRMQDADNYYEAGLKVMGYSPEAETYAVRVTLSRHTKIDGSVQYDELASKEINMRASELTPYTSRLTPLTSLIMRFEIFPKMSFGISNQSAVMPSTLVTARSAITLS